MRPLNIWQRSVVFLAACALVALVLAPPMRSASGSGITLSLPARDDAYVSASAPAKNYGTATSLRASSSSGHTKYIYYQFDVIGIPAGSTVSSATLRIFSVSGVAAVAVRSSATGWTQGTLKWNNRPAPDTLLNPPSVIPAGRTAKSFQSVDVTAAVKGNGLVSFQLDTQSTTDQVFQSKEAMNRPTLLVSTTAPETTTTTTQATTTTLPDVTTTDLVTTTTTEQPTTTDPPSSTDAVTTTTVPATTTPALTGTADEVHFTFTSPTSVTFDWRGTAGTIQYGITSAYGDTVAASTPSPLPVSSAGPFWEATLSGLQPGTTYHYSMGGEADRTVTTVPMGDFRFDEEADIGASLTSNYTAPTQSQILADNPAFVLAPGDMTYGNTKGQANVDQHFNDIMTWSRSVAYMPAWGNHEWDVACTVPITPTTKCDTLDNYKGRFALPNPQVSPGSVSAGGEDWYWFDAGVVRFIAYPEPWTSATWTDWQTKAGALMADAQADPSIRFIVTFGHRPAYSTGHHLGSTTLAGILNGFGDTYTKYRLNLNGHSHNYERFVPSHGVTHITGAGGGATLETSGLTTDPNSVLRLMHLEHLRIDVTASNLHIEAVCGPATGADGMACAQGSVIDSVDIVAP